MNVEADMVDRARVILLLRFFLTESAFQAWLDTHIRQQPPPRWQCDLNSPAVRTVSCGGVRPRRSRPVSVASLAQLYGRIRARPRKSVTTV